MKALNQSVDITRGTLPKLNLDSSRHSGLGMDSRLHLPSLKEARASRYSSKMGSPSGPKNPSALISKTIQGSPERSISPRDRLVGGSPLGGLNVKLNASMMAGGGDKAS